MVAAVVAFRRERWLWVGVLLALAAGVKIFALVAAPFLLGFKWRAWLALIVTGVAVAWPFGLKLARAERSSTPDRQRLRCLTIWTCWT